MGPWVSYLIFISLRVLISKVVVIICNSTYCEIEPTRGMLKRLALGALVNVSCSIDIIIIIITAITEVTGGPKTVLGLQIAPLPNHLSQDSRLVEKKSRKDIWLHSIKPAITSSLPFVW